MPNLSNPVTFLFAGDGSLASDGLSAFLQTKSSLLLVSECRDGATAVTDIQTNKPDIAVIDAQLPDMSVRQIIDAVRTNNSETRIIVLGASAERCVADELLAAGADAYIVRSGPSRHLNEAIRYVRDGGRYLCPQLTRDTPVPLDGHSDGVRCEVESRLNSALEAQARTVAKLEQALDRAQCAIEILQQKVEQLSAAPVEIAVATPAVEASRSHARPGVRTMMSGAAAALVVAVLGFQLAGILKPAAAKSIQPPAATPAAATPALDRLSGWDWENVENARSLLQEKQYAAAERICRMVIKRDPGNTAAARILASALFHQNRVAESADVIQSIAVPSKHR
jgi:DNA-binding NarL/FixJ family response regulator